MDVIDNSQNPALAAQRNDPSFDNVFQELQWRGLIHVSTDESALEDALAGEPITYYCGFDPTAASLHIGNLVQLLTVRRIQLAGHRPLGLVGGATGLIGDPKQAGERVLNTPETIVGWVQRLQSQVQRFLSFEGDNAAQMVNNLDWWQDIGALEMMRDIGKYFRVGTMIKKEIVAKRLNSEEGISYTEFSYQLLQGYDFLRLHQDYGCVMQTGGSDQWGNITAGTELVRRAAEVPAHALATPLITNADGTKFGKSEGNAIWLDAELCSPYTFYQFWLNSSDTDVITRLKVFTFLTRAEVEELEKAVESEPFKRQAQKRLAWEVTVLVHGEEATRKVIAASEALFGKGEVSEIDETTLAAVATEVPTAVLSADEVTPISALAETGLVPSKAEARRAIKQGGAYLNNVKVDDAESLVPDSAWLHGMYLLMRRGKKSLAVVIRAQ
ncbi:tyrosine--tRNA ligase [Nesterenkonia ebinurensis]|uniref:tyrosine--tRNA ligase n=1 Tax=Nesterenkonia ebinurensis TaxID=2608252 RepID=UPI0037C7BD97